MKLPSDSNPMRAYASKVAASTSGSTLASLGQQLFNDTTLSYPKGQACVSCHSPSVAFTFPNSAINLTMGPVPGAVHGRFGNRLVPSVTYAKFSPPGPFYDPDVQTYVGGQFWDGRATDQTAQAQFPEFNPNEMNDIVDNQHPSPALLMDKLAHSPEAGAFRSVFGQHAFEDSHQVNLQRIGQAIAAFEATSNVSPFTSKYDAYLKGQATLTASEMNGLVLFTGSVTGRPGGPAAYKNAKCNDCHGIPNDPSSGPDIFSNFCYTNIGVPRNPGNPFYAETDKHSNPLGYNPQGTAYVDLGLGDFLYPSYGLPSGNQGKGANGQGDFLAINGTFKAPSLRNIDKRPSAGFVRAYMHNGNFKSLQDVVHFYNTRNLTTYPGEVIDFTKPNPYAGLKGKPLQRQPEYPSLVTLNNPQGLTPEQGGEVGNLGLTPQEEEDIIAFLKTLSDGYR
jgi:cytochrome c peroxidase